jgi:hypothetical protein
VYDPSLVLEDDDGGVLDSTLAEDSTVSDAKPDLSRDVAETDFDSVVSDSETTISDAQSHDTSIEEDAMVADSEAVVDSSDLEEDGAAEDSASVQDASAAEDSAVGQDAEGTEDSSDIQDAEATQDAAADAVIEDTGPACGGTLLFGLCWYLTPTEISCNQHCADRGGYNAETASHVGTSGQGGSVDDCEDILNALGHSGSVSSGSRTDGNGYGCHIWSDNNAWWLSSPDFDPSDSSSNVTIACACNN